MDLKLFRALTDLLNWEQARVMDVLELYNM